jgi:hypothetical protein
VRITVQLDERRLRGAARQLGHDRAPVAVARALNRTVRTVRTHASRDVAKDMGIAKGDVMKAMTLKDATRFTLKALVSVFGRRMPLSRFRARQTRRGVTYRLPGGRDLLPGGFIATMRSDHEGVFLRRRKARLPIDEKFGPSVPYVFAKAKITDALKRLARSTFSKNLERETKFLERGSH